MFRTVVIQSLGPCRPSPRPRSAGSGDSCRREATTATAGIEPISALGVGAHRRGRERLQIHPAQVDWTALPALNSQREHIRKIRSSPPPRPDTSVPANLHSRHRSLSSRTCHHEESKRSRTDRPSLRPRPIRPADALDHPPGPDAPRAAIPGIWLAAQKPFARRPSPRTGTDRRPRTFDHAGQSRRNRERLGAA